MSQKVHHRASKGRCVLYIRFICEADYVLCTAGIQSDGQTVVAGFSGIARQQYDQFAVLQISVRQLIYIVGSKSDRFAAVLRRQQNGVAIF